MRVIVAHNAGRCIARLPLHCVLTPTFDVCSGFAVKGKESVARNELVQKFPDKN